MELLKQLNSMNLPHNLLGLLAQALAMIHRFFYLKYLFTLELKPSKTLELALVVLLVSFLSLALASHLYLIYHPEARVEEYQPYLFTQE